jgi:hypothetical protein
MKIAFVVSFFDFRNDVRRVIAEVVSRQEVIVFGKAHEADQIRQHLPSGVDFRTIDEKKPTWWNSFWERLYLLFRAIPRSSENFFLMELFKASVTRNPAQRKKNYRILNWVRRLPKIISYDTYLNGLQLSQQTQIDDIDQFFFFTAIADDYLLARLMRAGHPKVHVYVYSWDHPCKHTCFSRRARYLVWNEALGRDVSSLQNIPVHQVQVTGASQFGYIEEYYRNYAKGISRLYDFEYVYFGCAIGTADLVPDEVRVIELVSKVLATTRPDLRLVVRPYPVQANWVLYDPIRRLSNVVIDDGYRNLDLSVKEINIMEKFEKIENAEAFFHLGTTMGLEACFTSTPSFIIDMGYTTQQGLSLYNFIHQYQNDRHLIDLAPQNAITSEQRLIEVVNDLTQPGFMLLNQRVQSDYTVKSFANFAKDLVST